MIFCDFHTHDPAPKEGVLKVVSLPALPKERMPGVFYALQLHPWDLPDEFAGLPAGFAEEAARADALGETGLDRLKGPPLGTQLAYLEALLKLAKELHKPVVFHCVRAFPELLQAVRPYTALPKLLHGFSGNEEKRKMLHEAGFLLSGTRPGADVFETDAGSLSIQEIYLRNGAIPETLYRERLRSWIGA